MGKEFNCEEAGFSPEAQDRKSDKSIAAGRTFENDRRMRRLEPLRQIFTLDLRSIALFRICLALVTLYDLAGRWPDLAAFLSDEGFFSRSEYLEAIDRPWALSLYLLVGDPIQIQIIASLQALCAVVLLIGWRPQIFAAILWFLTGSLINRNPLAINGGDTLLSLLYFWAIFLPLGARWSVSAGKHSLRGKGVIANAWCDWAGVGLVLQIVIVYWTTVALKSDPVWWNGTAIRDAFKLDILLKPLAYSICPYEGFLAVLTWITILLEWIGPALILLPRGQPFLRPLVIASFCGLHLGTYFTMELALFPWVSMTAWMALIPGSFWKPPMWRQADRRLETGAEKWAAAESTSPVSTVDLRMGPLTRVVCIVTIGFILVWVSRPILPDEIEEQITHDLQSSSRLFRLRQSWSMFAPRPPRSDSWYVLRARQANGSEIDLLNGGQVLSWEKPRCASCVYPNRRWTKYLTNIGKRSYRDLREPFGDYFVRQWNEAHDVGYQVVEVELYAIRERIETPDDPPERLRLWYRRKINPSL